MMNYKEWTDRAGQFIARFERLHPRMKARVEIGPPATADQIAEAERGIGQALPRQLRTFLESASGHCDFGYWWEAEGEEDRREAESAFETTTIPGGLEYFAWVRALAEDYEFHRELVEEGTYGDAPFCQAPLPIGGMGNGDHIAIDLNGGSVIFLSHDDWSFILAPDFDAFLRSWEAICYLDFDISPYERFVDKDGGGIDPTDRPELRRLRRLLLPDDRGGRP
ncbi:SMI1/KNR4 family protein [Tautonia plasticadhaerens]|uniref:SMI1 / KNR4 family protein n=1 Tax=Tautonia plasticadhaerens TaxID=2527974 RepID=A0A518H4J2_9BACT|nr:SMI1/KNR4 family protein [Tautonia plasticadhaerens]QDV35753.1 SMI1 / KNR4 family protein [Tautonia plasticadhaerens]